MFARNVMACENRCSVDAAFSPAVLAERSLLSLFLFSHVAQTRATNVAIQGIFFATPHLCPATALYFVKGKSIKAFNCPT